MEWPTIALWVGVWAAITGALFMGPLLAVALLVPALTLHASISHEVLHGHPFRSRRWSEALVWVNPGLLVPYWRFRATHLEHHRDARLTDPYDDPECQYLDPAVWQRLPRWFRRVLKANNTLLGRMVLGPVLGQVAFMRGDWRRIRQGDKEVLHAWLWHGVGCGGVLWGVILAPLPVWAYGLAVYGAASLLRVRTYLEHRAHERPCARTVIIEGRDILAFLFLNNSLHAVHHAHPGVPWYHLPRLYAAKREAFLGQNGGYAYGSYGEIFRAHFLKAKDPVPHPIWKEKGTAELKAEKAGVSSVS